MKKPTAAIVDAHHHLWDLSLNKNSWLISEIEESHLGDYAKIRNSYLVADFLQDSKNFTIEKSVHIQAGWDRNDPLGESQWLEQLQLATNYPTASVFYADLSSDHTEDTLAKHASIHHTRGVRQILSWHENPYYRGCGKDYLQVDTWRKNFGLLGKYQLSFDMQIYPEQVDSVYPILAHHDEIPVVISHALMPIERDRNYLSYWRKQLKKLSAFPNVYIKISGIAMFDHCWTIESFRDIILPVVETFSPSRCMVGSNFPVDKLYGSFDDIMSSYIQILAGGSEHEQANMFRHVAEKFYRIAD